MKIFQINLSERSCPIQRRQFDGLTLKLKDSWAGVPIKNVDTLQQTNMAMEDPHFQ